MKKPIKPIMKKTDRFFIMFEKSIGKVQYEDAKIAA